MFGRSRSWPSFGRRRRSPNGRCRPARAHLPTARLRWRRVAASFGDSRPEGSAGHAQTYWTPCVRADVVLASDRSALLKHLERRCLSRRRLRPRSLRRRDGLGTADRRRPRRVDGNCVWAWDVRARRVPGHVLLRNARRARRRLTAALFALGIRGTWPGARRAVGGSYSPMYVPTLQMWPSRSRQLYSRPP